MLKRPKSDDINAPPEVTHFYEGLDSGRYDYVAFTLKNPNDRNLTMAINSIPFYVPANSVTPIKVSIAQLAEAYAGKVEMIPTINITAVPGQDEFSLYLDGFGLMRQPQDEPFRAQQALLQASDFARQLKADRFVLGVESPMRHVFLESHRYTPRFEPVYSMKAARNESESFQLVVVPFQGNIEDVTWRVKAPVNDAGSKLPLTVRVVGYVHCGQVKYVLNAMGGWYPDLLVEATSVAKVPQGQNLNLWVKVQVPNDATPGDYEGSVTVSAKGAKAQSVAVKMTVWPLTLPTQPNLLQAYSLNEGYNGHGLAKIYPKERITEMQSKYEDMLVRDYRMDANNIYRTKPPKHWNAARLRQLVDWGMTGICLGQFPSHPEYYPDTNPDLNARVAEIREYLKVVDAADARKLCYFYGFDEVQDEDGLKRLFETTAKLKKEFPGIPFLTTATAYQNCRGALLPGAESVDWWCPISGAFSDPTGLKNTQQAVAKGHGMWWYICNCSPPPEPNFDLEVSPTEPRILMGALSAKYNIKGFLYYALVYWGNNGLPADTSKLPYVDWVPNGISWPDCYNGQGILLAAGENGPIPTIRMEMIRDGLEDFDLYTILRANGEVGIKLAEVSPTIARDTHTHTTDPQVLEDERVRLATEIITLQSQQLKGGAK